MRTLFLCKNILLCSLMFIPLTFVSCSKIPKYEKFINAQDTIIQGFLGVEFDDVTSKGISIDKKDKEVEIAYQVKLRNKSLLDFEGSLSKVSSEIVKEVCDLKILGLIMHKNRSAIDYGIFLRAGIVQRDSFDELLLEWEKYFYKKNGITVEKKDFEHWYFDNGKRGTREEYYFVMNLEFDESYYSSKKSDNIRILGNLINGKYKHEKSFFSPYYEIKYKEQSTEMNEISLDFWFGWNSNEYGYCKNIISIYGGYIDNFFHYIHPAEKLKINAKYDTETFWVNEMRTHYLMKFTDFINQNYMNYPDIYRLYNMYTDEDLFVLEGDDRISREKRLLSLEKIIDSRKKISSLLPETCRAFNKIIGFDSTIEEMKKQFFELVNSSYPAERQQLYSQLVVPLETEVIMVYGYDNSRKGNCKDGKIIQKVKYRTGKDSWDYDEFEIGYISLKDLEPSVHYYICDPLTFFSRYK